ncbi:unnamed protein product [Urochloa decumbens]|uniref:F-box domain-containing protein n=1 Tax=Urochloa decumbens TaxID=240449 RepID=A0ABC8ZK85_9POAL
MPLTQAAAWERHISSLGDDLLLEIFLRLPSLATLVRAGCTCRAWRRAVASSPGFRRRFRALHPPPLLGFFTDNSIVAESPAFVPARPHGRDLAAAVRGGDFSLTSLESPTPEEEEVEAPGWKILTGSCRRGNLILLNWEDKLLAVANPLTQRSERVPRLVSKSMLQGCQGHSVLALLSSEEDPVPSRLMLLDHPGSRMKATIFSMDTGVCSETPYVDVPACPDQPDGRVLNGSAVQLNGSVFYLLENWRYTVSVDTATMEFTVMELPQWVWVSPTFFEVGETKDGATCLVYSDGLDVGVLMHTRGADGAQKWVLDRVVSMGAELQRVLQGQFDGAHALEVFAVKDGYAYLSASLTLQHPGNRYWFLSLCLGTMKLEKLFQGTYGCSGVPYIMPWPRSLVGNYGRFALNQRRSLKLHA